MELLLVWSSAYVEKQPEAARIWGQSEDALTNSEDTLNNNEDALNNGFHVAGKTIDKVKKYSQTGDRIA
ncbi:MAG: hypothetical protein K9I47_09345 [Bacteroidales bacterium]|nr:hypothetical protein [Bacteroidales bacterium]